MEHKLGSELAVGDTLEFLGRNYTITHFSERRPFLGCYTGRAAYSGTWGITLLDSDRWLKCPTHGTWDQHSCQHCYKARTK